MYVVPLAGCLQGIKCEKWNELFNNSKTCVLNNIYLVPVLTWYDSSCPRCKPCATSRRLFVAIVSLPRFSTYIPIVNSTILRLTKPLRSGLWFYTYNSFLTYVLHLLRLTVQPACTRLYRMVYDLFAMADTIATFVAITNQQIELSLESNEILIGFRPPCVWTNI